MNLDPHAFFQKPRKSHSFTMVGSDAVRITHAGYDTIIVNQMVLADLIEQQGSDFKNDPERYRVLDDAFMYLTQKIQEHRARRYAFPVVVQVVRLARRKYTK